MISYENVEDCKREMLRRADENLAVLEDENLTPELFDRHWSMFRVNLVVGTACGNVADEIMKKLEG